MRYNGKVMRRSIVTRLAIIGFFLGFNFVLGQYFLEYTNAQLPPMVSRLLPPDKIERLSWLPFDKNSLKEPKDFANKLESGQVIAGINEHRSELGLSALETQPVLTQAATHLLDSAQRFNFNFEHENFNVGQELENFLSQKDYQYVWIGQSSLMGPLTSEGVLDTWLRGEVENEALNTTEATEIGLATRIVRSQQYGTVGIVVQLIAEPRSEARTISDREGVATQPAQRSFRDIPDDEVVEALNTYRQAHGVHPLNINDNLCQYAQKRVNDLVAYGGLDNHEGFRRDFANPDEPPVGIRDYRPGLIGENLAYQHCRNMQTGESFIAETGTALIEWCFDSSTLGHREAQLSSNFQNVCVRHAEGMYVIIFGE